MQEKGITESWNILSWKGPIRIIGSNPWQCIQETYVRGDLAAPRAHTTHVTLQNDFPSTSS